MTRVTWFSVLVIAISVLILGMIAPVSGQRPQVATCKVSEETATQNSRREVAYYECLAVNGAIVPSVTFVVHGDSAGDVWLRSLIGRTVDVRLEVVK